ncbi:MAG: transposase [Bacteroidales bacterium]|nr:transposase [Bacteroidales bacterium]
MDLLNFIERFQDENDCFEYFKSIREKSGIICKKCGHNKHIWLAGKVQFECKQCGNRISIKSGTVMENSKLPIKCWFITIHILTSSKKTFSALEIQRYLGYPEYKSVCEMLHNLHLVMDKGSNEYTFKGLLFACVNNQIPRYETTNDQQHSLHVSFSEPENQHF